MNNSQKTLEQAIARVLKPLGYTKRAATWHRAREQVISVLNLQKSQWGEDWYLNLGVYLKALGSDAHPSEARCHIRCRADVLNEGVMPRDPDALTAFTREIAVPYFDALGTERGVAEFLRADQSEACLVHHGVRELLNRSSDPAAT